MSLPVPDSLAIYSIGLKLRTLRAAKHMTLSRLAAQSNLSTALLSKLENDRMVPTLETLERICRVYGISLGHFFCEPQLHSVAITRKEHTVSRQRDQQVLTTPLHVPTSEGRQVSQIIDIPAGACSTFGESGVTSELTAYVIEGTPHATVGGAHERLDPGDSIVVTTDQPMVWSAAKSPHKILSVFARRSLGNRLE